MTNSKKPKPASLHNIASQRWITLGNVGRPYGIHGWVKIFSHTQPYTNIIQYTPWYLLLNSTWQKVTVTDCKPHGKALIAHIAGYDTPEAVRYLVNAKIGVLREQLPPLPEDTHYWADLEGVEVYNLEGQHLGTVIGLMNAGAQDILEIASPTSPKTLLIPYVRGPIILEVNLPERKILADWQEDYL